MKEKYLYILRYTVQPGHQEEKRMEELSDFCRSAQIDDVLFFIDCEEINQGHITLEDAKPWMEFISESKMKLDSMGITTSINPWTTLLHSSKGRKLKEKQNFTPMVDPYGNASAAVACPLCSSWRRYICDAYAYYASVKPHMLWVEDDFRLHNHGAILIWGGCFCEKHLEAYSAAAGHKLDREEFVTGIWKQGEPHHYRKIWLDISGKTMVNAARAIGEAVHRISPSTRVGLMSSYPSVHCAEGRNWEGLLHGLACGTPMVNRPHLPAYSDVTPQEYLWNFNQISRMTQAMVPDSTETYPELENFPFTLFSKSRTFMRFQLETSLALNPMGTTMNLFNMMGSGVIFSDGYQDVLAECKEFLSEIKNLGLRVQKQEGVKIPICPESSYTIHTVAGRSMEELYPKEGFWAGLLSSFGIANTYSLDKTHKNSIVAISGQYFRNLGRKEIEDIFNHNFVLLEGEAAYTLWEMGLGSIAEIESAEWYDQDSGFQAYEQVCDGNTYCGKEEARITSQAASADFLKIEYTNKPVWKTAVKNPGGRTVAAGMTSCNNRFFILPYGHFDERYKSHLNPFRQKILHDILKTVKIAKCPVIIEDAPYISVLSYEEAGKKIIMIFNASPDSYSNVKIYIPGMGGTKIMESSRCNPGFVEANAIWNEDYIILKSDIHGLESKVLTLE